MMQEDLVCPSCGQPFLRTHSKLVDKDGHVTVYYEWSCGWCGRSFGEYTSKAEAREDYNKQYGGR